MLFNPGFGVPPPVVFHRTDKIDEQRFAALREKLARRLDTLSETPPVPFRRQNHCDYLIPSLNLRPKLAPEEHGLVIHMKPAESLCVIFAALRISTQFIRRTVSLHSITASRPATPLRLLIAINNKHAVWSV